VQRLPFCLQITERRADEDADGTAWLVQHDIILAM
jgi:hypothetical protein